MDITKQLLDQTILFSLLVVEKIFPVLGQKYKEDLTFHEFYTIMSINYFGNTKMTDFAYDLGIKKQQATRVINSLVEKGFIKRSYEESDRRIVKIGLTPHAEAYLKEFTNETSLLFGDALENLSQSEIKEYHNAIETINRMLSKMKV